MHSSTQAQLAAEWADASGAELRAAVRAGRFSGPTAGLARGYVQANLVVLPAEAAEEFADFCRLNPRPCPLLEQTAVGNPEPRQTALGADLRTDLPRYRVFRGGQLDPREPTDIRDLWQDDLVGFLLGCSFSFENALEQAGLPPRHVVERHNVPMYRTSLLCRRAGRFGGNLVVSMRPYRAEAIERVIEITGRYPTMHGAPVHAGDPRAIGITDLARPDFGDAVTIQAGEVPLFWACGVTPQVALADARCSLAITHSPGCMFVTDWRDAEQQALPG